MGDSFTFCIETRHYEDEGKQENVHNLPADTLKKREVDFIGILTKINNLQYQFNGERNIYYYKILPIKLRIKKPTRKRKIPHWYVRKKAIGDL